MRPSTSSAEGRQGKALGAARDTAIVLSRLSENIDRIPSATTEEVYPGRRRFDCS